MTDTSELDRLKRLLAVAADDLWPLCIGRESGSLIKYEGDQSDFRLFVNCNDTFAPAADAEMVPIEEEEAVIALARATEFRPTDDSDAALIEWVAKKRGIKPPYHWRSRLRGNV